MAIYYITMTVARKHNNSVVIPSLFQGRRNRGGDTGYMYPPLTTKGGGTSHALVPPLLLMKLFDCFGLLCNLSLILLYLI